MVGLENYIPVPLVDGDPLGLPGNITGKKGMRSLPQFGTTTQNIVKQI
jgi:hypothetical protein